MVVMGGLQFSGSGWVNFQVFTSGYVVFCWIQDRLFYRLKVFGVLVWYL